jgi:cytochrome c oxidase subunit 2
MNNTIKILNLLLIIIMSDSKVYNDSPSRWQMIFQDEATPIMIGIRDLHDNILFYLIWILLFVAYWIIVNIVQRSTKIRSKDLNHSSIIEFIWTIIPALILIIIAIPSFQLLYSMDDIIKPLITLKVQGSQWFWTYNILDTIGINIDFTSYPKPIEDLEKGEINLLEVDNRVLLPILTPIRVLITANDVMHSWAVPSLGIKIDAIPGRTNHGFLYILREGVYYGQCSELCGQGHAYMPIVIEGVKLLDYVNWLISFSEIKTSTLIKVSNIFNNILNL